MHIEIYGIKVPILLLIVIFLIGCLGYTGFLLDRSNTALALAEEDIEELQLVSNDKDDQLTSERESTKIIEDKSKVVNTNLASALNAIAVLKKANGQLCLTESNVSDIIPMALETIIQSGDTIYETGDGIDDADLISLMCEHNYMSPSDCGATTP